VKHVEAQGAPPVESLDQYVVINKADVLDAIGSFVAAYLVTIPEAQNLQPVELQNALKKTFKVSTYPWLVQALEDVKMWLDHIHCDK
jgi:hypothetical protein